MAKLCVSVVVLVLLQVTSPTFCEELVFPFTVDQNIKSEDITQIPTERDIQNDKWFMSPPTRIEFLTYIIDQQLKKEFEQYWEYSKEKIERYFEPLPRRFVSVRTSVWFWREKDIFVAAVEIDGLGKAKKPMKEVCDELIKGISLWFPGHYAGYWYENKFLGPFIQTSPNDPELLQIVSKLQRNFLVRVKLESSFDQRKDSFPTDYYIMQCYKCPEEKETHYSKQTFRISR